MGESSGTPPAKAVIGVMVALAAIAAALVTINLFMVPKASGKCVTPEDCRTLARHDTVLVGSRSALNVAVVVVGLFVVLGVAGVDTKALLISAGILGAVLGLGAQGVIRSFISGLVILGSNRLSLGDLVQLQVFGVMGGGGGGSGGGGADDAASGGAAVSRFTGVVKHFSLLTTTIQDATGAKTSVSNGVIMSITNYSQNPQRVTVAVSVPRTTDPVDLRAPLETFIEHLALDDELKGKVLRPPSLRGITSSDAHSYTVTVSALSTPDGAPTVERHIRERLLHHLAPKET